MHKSNNGSIKSETQQNSLEKLIEERFIKRIPNGQTTEAHSYILAIPKY